MTEKEKAHYEYQDKLSIYHFQEYLYSLRHLYDMKNFDTAKKYQGDASR